MVVSEFDMDLFKFTVIDKSIYIVYRNTVDNTYTRLCFENSDTLRKSVNEEFIDKNISFDGLLSEMEKEFARGSDTLSEYLERKGTFDKESLYVAINNFKEYQKQIATQEYEKRGLLVKLTN